jgi:hypothetical protein
MALPPVITNIPFLKLFRSEHAFSKPVNDGKTETAAPKDTVEISEAAQKKFESTKPLSLSNPEVLRKAIGDAKAALENGSFDLGLDPDFS